LKWILAVLDEVLLFDATVNVILDEFQVIQLGTVEESILHPTLSVVPSLDLLEDILIEEVVPPDSPTFLSQLETEKEYVQAGR
jgi:hypothetical protein